MHRVLFHTPGLRGSDMAFYTATYIRCHVFWARAEPRISDQPLQWLHQHHDPYCYNFHPGQQRLPSQVTMAVVQEM